MKTLEAGASTTVWAAVSEDLNEKGGLYLENCVISKEVDSVESRRCRQAVGNIRENCKQELEKDFITIFKIS